VSSISLEKFFEVQQSGRLLLFDVRPAIVHAFGAIPGAVNWPKPSFDQDLPVHEPEIRKASAAGKAVVIYCTDAECPDARSVADRLAALGFDVAVYEGGYAEWKESGLAGP
jgi:rhodanese-related sulfurtransferase